VEELVFVVSYYLRVHTPTGAYEALQALETVLDLLPSDVYALLTEEVDELDQILKHKIPRLAEGTTFTLDEYIKKKRKYIVANRYRKWMHDTVRKIQRLLYEKHLVRESLGRSIYDTAQGKKSGEGTHEKFARREHARI